MNTTTVTTPNELEIRVERIFDAPRTHVYSVWTDPALIPEWWGDGTVVEEMDVRAGYNEENAYYWARSSIFMGSALLQNSGVVIVNHDGSKYT